MLPTSARVERPGTARGDKSARTPLKLASFLEHAHGDFLDKLGELATRKAINDHAIVEDVCGGAANIDGRVYMQQAKKLAAQLKVMRATERELRLRQRPDHEATAIPLADVAC